MGTRSGNFDGPEWILYKGPSFSVYFVPLQIFSIFILPVITLDGCGLPWFRLNGGTSGPPEMDKED